MAKKTADTVRLNFDIELKADQIPILAGMMTPVPGHTDLQYIRDMAELLLDQQANGGVMFSPEEVKLVQDSVGITLDTAENLLPHLYNETAMQDGMHRVTVLIDPANYPAYEELAHTQERTVDSLMQEVVDMVQENEWVYELHPRPQHVLMTETQALQLAELLGDSFATGAELYHLVLKKLAPEPEESVDELFAESNVGLEA
jgi:hypothetical protein